MFISKIFGFNSKPSIQIQEVAPEPKKTKKPSSITEFVSSKDGQTYQANLVTTDEGKKQVFVHLKDTQPDKNGEIAGEVMTQEDFAKKLSQEAPRVTSSHIRNYCPNMADYKEELKFDIDFREGVKLTNGETLLRPLESKGYNHIEPINAKGLYFVVYTNPNNIASESIPDGFKKVVSEKELIEDKTLCAGTIKPLNDTLFKLTAYTNRKNPNELTRIITAKNKQELIRFMKANHCYL